MTRTLILTLVAACLTLTVGCGDAPTAVADSSTKTRGAAPTPMTRPMSELPARLSQTPWSTGEREVFAPRFKLFTGEAEKVREVALPEGAMLESDGKGGWVAPEGTFLFKSLFIEGERIETRVAAKLQGRWVMSAYVWSGDDALRVDDPQGLDAPGGHHIPAASDCLTCHGANDGETITPRPVAFAPLMLDHEGEGLTTSSLLADGRFHGKPAAPVQSDDPQDLEALGYLAVNCGTCHRDGGAASFSPMRLDIDPATGRFRALDAVGLAASYGPSVLIKAGSPAESLLFVRMAATDGARMPLMAPPEHDDAGLALVAGFIERLGERAHR